MTEPSTDPLVGVLLQIAATVAQIDQRLGRIATALERLVPPVPPSQPAPCVRCGGQGWLGNQAVSCPTCSGTGHRPT